MSYLCRDEDWYDTPDVVHIKHPKPRPEDVKDGDCVNCGAPRSHVRHHPFSTFTRDCCVFDDGKPAPQRSWVGPSMMATSTGMGPGMRNALAVPAEGEQVE